jgi:hypothetical protein
MKSINERNFIRILHLVLSVPILGYLYGPVESIPRSIVDRPPAGLPLTVVPSG